MPLLSVRKHSRASRVIVIIFRAIERKKKHFNKRLLLLYIEIRYRSEIILLNHQNNYVELKLIARMSKFFVTLLIMIERFTYVFILIIQQNYFLIYI